LSVLPLIIDLDTTEERRKRFFEIADGIIIATPTKSHFWDVKECLRYRLPILCEKPFSKNPAHVAKTVADAEEASVPFRMVNQYRYLMDPLSSGETFYDYWAHGKDGLPWDCISIVALAKERVTLAEKSPIWRCTINGAPIDIRKMDQAYIAMIDQWTKAPSESLEEDYEYIKEAHSKVLAFEKGSTVA
jgi:hypothetical protein